MRRAIAAVLVLGVAVPAQGQVAPPDDDTIVVAFTGDTLIHPGLSWVAARNGRPYDFRPMFEPVRHLISGADFAICHLEVPLSPTNSDLSGYPRFNSPREVADGLVDAGFDSCSTASNHSWTGVSREFSGLFQVLEEAGLRQAGMRSRVLDYWDDTVYDVRGAPRPHIRHLLAQRSPASPRDGVGRPAPRRRRRPDSGAPGQAVRGGLGRGEHALLRRIPANAHRRTGRHRTPSHRVTARRPGGHPPLPRRGPGGTGR